MSVTDTDVVAGPPASPATTTHSPVTTIAGDSGSEARLLHPLGSAMPPAPATSTRTPNKSNPDDVTPAEGDEQPRDSNALLSTPADTCTTEPYEVLDGRVGQDHAGAVTDGTLASEGGGVGVGSIAAFDRAAWLAERRNGIGASDVAGILGLSPWSSPYSIWADKVFGSDDEGESLAMEFGRRAEVMVAPWFTEKTGLYVGGEQTPWVHPNHNHHRCTIDGLVYEHPSPLDPTGFLKYEPVGEYLGALEIKCTSATPKEWEEDGIPIQYQCQAQWTMHVTGTDHLWFAVLHLAFGRPDLQVYELARDQVDVDLIVTAVDAFWHDHVLTGQPPETDGHPATTYATKHLPASAGDTVDITPELIATVAAVAGLKNQRKGLDEQIETRENAIRAALGFATEGHFDGQLMVSHRPQSKRFIDEAAFRGSMPVTAGKFTKTTEFRVLRQHKPPKPKKGKT